MKTLWAIVTTTIIAVAAPVSDARPQATCRAGCQRLRACGMSGYAGMCLDDCMRHRLEASRQGRAMLVAVQRLSCPQIQRGLATMFGEDDDADELDRLDQELAELEEQLAADEAELDRRAARARARSRRPAYDSDDAGLVTPEVWRCRAAAIPADRDSLEVIEFGQTRDQARANAVQQCETLLHRACRPLGCSR